MTTPLPKGQAKRERTEKSIVRAALLSFISEGYFVRIFNGETYTCDRTRNFHDAYNACFTTQQDSIFLYRPGSYDRYGWVVFKYGQGADIIADFTQNIFDELESCTAIAQRARERNKETA